MLMKYGLTPRPVYYCCVVCICLRSPTATGFFDANVSIIATTTSSSAFSSSSASFSASSTGAATTYEDEKTVVSTRLRPMRKSANVGSSRVLECEVHYPDDDYVQHIITWRKQGLDSPIFILFDGYPPRMDASYRGRIRLVGGQGSIEISDIRATDEGWYECSVLFLDKSDDASANGTWIHLSVNVPPVLVEVSPALLIQKEGESVEIFCEAKATPRPTLTWYKEGVELVASESVTISGNTVYLKGLRRDDAGVYMCLFKNLVGSVSYIIKLAVEGDGWISSGNAYIVQPPKNTTVLEGSRVRLTCQAEGYPDNLTYTWYRNGVDVRQTPSLIVRGQVLADGTLTINNVAKDDTGWYTCRATNNFGKVPEAKAYLNVTYLPRVLNMPNRVYLALNLIGRIDCQVESNPPLTIILWSKGHEMIDFVTNRHVRVDKYGSLVFNPVRSTDEGQYTCTPYSPLGPGHTSPPVQVYVRASPHFVIRPKPLYQRQPTQSVTFPCQPEGDPKPTLSWRKADGGEFPPSGRVMSTSGGGNLTIVNLSREDQGLYECVAVNVVASIITTTLLIIELISPHAPFNITVETTPHSAKVSWLPAYDAGYPQHYVIWYRLLNTGVSSLDQWKTLRVVPSETTSMTIHQLLSNSSYEFMVLARNRIGDELYSSTVTSKTTGSSSSSGFISAVLHNNGSSSSSATPHPTESDDDDDYEDEDGEGVGEDDFDDGVVREPGFSGVLEFERPSSPVNLTVQQQRGSLWLSWRMADHSPLPVHYYIVQYKTVGQWVPLTSRLVNQTHYNWTTASRGATYHFRVLGYFHGNDHEASAAAEPVASLPSSTVTIHTGDPTSTGGGQVSNSILGAALGGLLVALVLLVMAMACLKLLQRWKRQQKCLQSGQMLDFSTASAAEADTEASVAAFDNHLHDPAAHLENRHNSAKETAI